MELMLTDTVFPARAGMSPLLTFTVWCKPSFPRPRGDEPLKHLQ